MLFSNKWLRNHPQFLLNFLIHTDILMLCRKFEHISTTTDTIFYRLLLVRLEPSSFNISQGTPAQFSIHCTLHTNTLYKKDLIYTQSLKNCITTI